MSQHTGRGPQLNQSCPLRWGQAHTGCLVKNQEAGVEKLPHKFKCTGSLTKSSSEQVWLWGQSQDRSKEIMNAIQKQTFTGLSLQHDEIHLTQQVNTMLCYTVALLVTHHSDIMHCESLSFITIILKELLCYTSTKQHVDGHHLLQSPVEVCMSYVWSMTCQNLL